MSLSNYRWEVPDVSESRGLDYIPKVQETGKIKSSDCSNRRLRLKLYTLFIHNFMYDTRRTVKKVNKLYLKIYLQNGNESDYLCKAYRLIISWYIRNKNSITLANLAFSDWIDTRVREVGSIYTGDNAKKFVEDFLDMIAVLEETN